MTEEKLRISSANDFRPRGWLLRLPSDRVVEVREVDLVGLMLTNDGDIPDFLSGYVMRGITGQRTEPTEFNINQDNLVDVFKFINVMVKAAVLKPKVMDAGARYDEGEINIDDLTTDDKQWIFQVVMPQEVGIAMSFRSRVEKANMELVSDSQDNGDTPLPNLEL